MRYVTPQCEIDKRLVATSAGRVYLRAKPVEHIVVDSDRYPGLPWRERNDGAALPPAKVILSFHQSPSYRRRSRRVAFRAEMSRICLSRTVKTTTKIRPKMSLPTVTNRSSPAAPSGIVTANGSSSTATASAKSIPCLRRLALAFPSSHSKPTAAPYAQMCSRSTGLVADSPWRLNALAMTRRRRMLRNKPTTSSRSGPSAG